jgi:hypothetical protein
MRSFIFRVAVVLGIGGAVLTGARYPVLGQGLMAPIPGLGPENQHPVENLHPIAPPSVKPLNMDAAKRAAATAEQHRLDQQGVSGSWAFPRNRRP